LKIVCRAGFSLLRFLVDMPSAPRREGVLNFFRICLALGRRPERLNYL
jgi:hypothetical protein